MTSVSKVSSADTPVTVNQPVNTGEVTKNKEVIVVPVEQNQGEQPQDTDKLPAGYCIEKTGDSTSSDVTASAPDDKPDSQKVNQEPPKDTTSAGCTSTTGNSGDTPVVKEDSNDEPDTEVHTDERITIDDIALSQSDKITSAIQNAEAKGLNSIIGEDYAEMAKATTMIKTDPHSIMEQDFKKGFLGNGIARYQHTNYTTTSEDDSGLEFNQTTNSERLDLSSTYESPKGNTKLALYASGTVTNNNIKGANSQTPIDQNASMDKYNLYMGSQFKLGKDKLNTSIIYADGGKLDESKITEIDARYNINKYNVTLDGSVELYQVGPSTSSKTNFSCYLNSKNDEETEKKKEDAADSPSDETNKVETTDNSNTQQNNKKWTKNDGLLIRMEAVNGGDVEEGIGYYQTYKKSDDKSFLKITMFGLGSTTPRKDEASSYCATTGVNMFYKYNPNKDLSLDVNIDTKDKVSFCGPDKGNTFTAFVDANCTYKKLYTRLEGKYINANSKYAAVALRTSYKANKNLLLFTDLSYEDKQIETARTKGTSVMVGANLKF